jgi:four helix bundle protein
MDSTSKFHEELKSLIGGYAHGIYAITRSFPKEEIYGVTSLLRCSALSVMLNYA